jgi:hypothetical protein
MKESEIPAHYNELKEFAESHGWTMTYSQNKGARFIKENTWIWQCRQGWQCADLIRGKFCNHKGFITGMTLGEMFEKY